MRTFVILTAIAVSLGGAAVADEPTFDAVGQAPVIAGDRVRARERAFDEALRQAVEQAAGTVMSAEELAQRASDLKLRVLPKAKQYVTTYRILDEGEAVAGTFQVHLSAQVAAARLARDLQTSSGSSGMTGLPRLSAKARASACAQAADPGLAQSAERVLKDVLGARSVEVLAPPGACSDEAAAQAARQAGAQGALTAIVESKPSGPVRGTALTTAHARARVHVLEADGRVSAEGDAEHDAYAPSDDRAVEAAAREAVSDAALKVQPSLAQKWAPQAPSQGVKVQLSGIQRFADYELVVRAISSLAGVAGVEPRRFARGQAELLIKTATPAGQLASGLQRVPPQGVRVSVRANGDGTLAIDVTSPSEPPSVPERG